MPPRPLPLPRGSRRWDWRFSGGAVARHRFAVPRQGQFYVPAPAAAIIFPVGRVQLGRAGRPVRLRPCP